MAEVEAAYHEIDDVVKLNGLSVAGESIHGAQLRDGEDGRYVDLRTSGLFPFDLAKTANAVWEFYSGPTKHRGPLYYKTAKVASRQFACLEVHNCV